MDKSTVLALLNKNYSIKFINLKFYRDGGSLSYLVFGNDRKYFLRKIRPVFMETVFQSIEIHLFLIKNKVPVPKIIFTKFSTPYVETVESDGKHVYILYEFIEGKESDITRDAEKIGELIGKYHKVMQSYNGELSIRDKYYFIDKYIEILRKMKYPESKVIAFKKHGDALWEKVKDIPRGYCHGDLYIGNIHQNQRGELFILDFDGSCYAYPLYDIALVCNSTDYFNFDECGYQKTKMILERFLLGYEQFFKTSDLERNSVFYLIAIYHYQLQAIIIEKNGLNCVDEEFLDKQYGWLKKWAKQCSNNEI